MKDAAIDEAQRTIANLARTPVGRRWLLKMGVSTAAALAVPAWAAAQGPQPPAPARRSRRGIVFQFALGPAAAALPDLTLVVNGLRIPLTGHTRSSRAALRSQGTLWSKMRLNALTHFAAAPLSPDRVHHLTVYATHNGQTVVVAQKFHAPATATSGFASAAFLLEGSYRAVAGSPQRLSDLGLDASQLTSLREVVDLDTVADGETTAKALCMHHPNVGTTNADEHKATDSLLTSESAVTTLGTTIKNMPGGFATRPQVLDRSGNPSVITIKGTTHNFNTIKFSTDTTFTNNARAAFTASLRTVRDSGNLGTVLDKPLDQSPPDTKTWHQAEGVIIHPTPYAPPTGLGAEVQVQLQNPGTVHGTRVEITGALSGQQLSLKLYNNFVRWVWVYVQYLKADGTNLSLNPNATFPDTKHAQSLGMLPQVFTVLGVPLWDTNTLDATLNFPLDKGATSARILFCGLGNNGVDGGWRQYFPADAYSADHIGPTDEVLFPALMTGIITFGLTGFMLVMDVDASGAFGAADKGAADDVEQTAQDFSDLLEGAPKVQAEVTALESDATYVLIGVPKVIAQLTPGATLDPNNIWNTVAAIAGVIPKVLFTSLLKSPMWAEVAAAVIADKVAETVVEAIPIIGEIMGVIAILGDVATLAEAIAETATSPWVIANQISLTYPATVTVSHDPRVQTWPRTATSYRIEAKIDGSTALSPITDKINVGGRIQSDPIVNNVVAPFGGATITWSIVVLDAQGNQVGTGTT
jgi:hypothetical protein